MIAFLNEFLNRTTIVSATLPLKNEDVTYDSMKTLESRIFNSMAEGGVGGYGGKYRIQHRVLILSA